jgi:CspA family cold shock protein
MTPPEMVGFCLPDERKADMTEGTVKFYNTAKGFGFITDVNGEDVFFHKSSVKNTGFRDVLLQGDQVQFEIKEEQKGKRAFNIIRK